MLNLLWYFPALSTIFQKLFFVQEKKNNTSKIIASDTGVNESDSTQWKIMQSSNHLSLYSSEKSLQPNQKKKEQLTALKNVFKKKLEDKKALIRRLYVNLEIHNLTRPKKPNLHHISQGVL
jgi:hypothetical protein